MNSKTSDSAFETRSAAAGTVDTLGTALTMVLGLQLLRVLVPMAMFLLRERLGWSTINAGLLVLAVFASGFLAGPLRGLIGSRRMFLLTASTVGLARLCLQIWTGDERVDLALAIVGVVGLVLFLPTSLGALAAARHPLPQTIGVGLLAGFALDIGLSGAVTTYDLAWQSGWLAGGVTTILVVGQVLLVLQMARSIPEANREPPFVLAIAWAAIGPYLFLQLLLYANIAAAAATTGWAYAAALGFLLFAHLVALGLIQLPWLAYRWLWLIAGTGALLFHTMGAFGETLTGWSAAFGLLAGQLFLAGLILLILQALDLGAEAHSLRNLSIANGVGMVLLVALLFGYYAAYDLQMPIGNNTLPLLALLLAIALAWPALRRVWPVEDDQSWRVPGRFAVVLSPLLLVPLLWMAFNPQPQPQAQTAANELSVMTYNLHNGFHPDGHLNLERLARNIEAEDPDIVGLQEVSRGWVINGSADMVTWLAQRLDMTIVFGPTADAQWGNAILTRLPVHSSGTAPLPVDDLLLRRGLVYVTIPWGDNQTLTAIATHYHNPADGGAIRVQQSEALLDLWAGKPLTLIMGDFNADRWDAEIQLLIANGLYDTWATVSTEPGYTNPVPGPQRRIDYIFASTDLRGRNATVPIVDGSDHLPVAAQFARQP